MRLPAAAELSPSRSPRQATTAVTTVAPNGDRRRSTLRSRPDAGRTPSRATEYIVRAVSAWAEMPQATTATSTIAANGLVDQEPNDVTTAVVTGSASWPPTTAFGSG